MQGTRMIANFNDHAANERTFLAWVRTAIGVVGFGLAIDRLGSDHAPPWLVIALLISCFAVVCVAYMRMIRLKARIDFPDIAEDTVERGDVMLALLVAVLFVMMVLFALHIW